MMLCLMGLEIIETRRRRAKRKKFNTTKTVRSSLKLHDSKNCISAEHSKNRLTQTIQMKENLHLCFEFGVNGRQVDDVGAIEATSIAKSQVYEQSS